MEQERRPEPSNPDTNTGGENTQAPLAERLHSGASAWVVLLLSLVVTLVAWDLSSSFAEERARDRFEFHVEDAQFAIQQRMLAYEQILRGGVALFQSSGPVDRTAWRSYVEALQLQENYPGIQGMGFAKWIAPTEVDAFVQGVRAEGFPDFTLRPGGTRNEYTSIVYLEPLDARNRRAFGFDMYSEPTRRAAMSRARDTGNPAVSAKVKLLQETEKDVQNGFLMYLPVYSAPPSTVAERQARLLGFVYSPFRIRDLMQGILGHDLPAIEFTLYDGEDTTESSVLYNSDPHPSTDQAGAPKFGRYATLETGGHIWTIHYRTTPAFDMDNRSHQPLMVAAGGVIIDVMLFYIIISLSRLRKRAAALADERMGKLAAREIQFKAITDSAHDAILSVDPTGHIAYVNAAGQSMFACSPADLLGKPLSDLASRQHAARLDHALRSPDPTQTSAPWELEGVRRDGRVFPMELSLARWRAGGEWNTTAVIRDLTERKKVERLKNEFVSTVSHELRTPLTAIRGSLGLIGGVFKDGPDERRSQLVAIANANVERLGRLINDILDIEKMESGTLDFTFQELPIQPLLQQSVEAHTSLAAQAGVSVALEGDTSVAVRVDPDRFQQVMTNLLGNAIKFSPRGGVVRASAQASGRFVRVEVSDQGPGIPDAFAARIFQKFAQADSSDTRQKGGTGLGLSICKTIVERFGGHIGYESSPGTGTRFYFDVPVALAGDHAATH